MGADAFPDFAQPISEQLAVSPTAAAAGTTYPVGRYWAYVSTSSGWPTTGTLIGTRSGTFNTQIVLSETGVATWRRVWDDGGTAWLSFELLNAAYLTGKGALVTATAAGVPAALAAGADFTQLISRAGAANGVEWGGLVTKYKTAAQSVSATTFANDTHLQFPVVSGAVYTIEGYIYAFATATTTGMKLAVNLTAAPTQLIFGAIGQITQGASGAASTFFGNTVNARDAATTLGASVVGTAVTTPSVALLHGLVQPSANDTLILRIAGEAAASITYMAGSWMRLNRVA